MPKTQFSYMRKYALIIAALTLPLIVFTFLWFSYNKQRQVRDGLNTAIRILRKSDNISDYREFAAEFKGALRITILDEYGNVLADNRINKDEMGNHADRPEFRAALEDGYGEDMRRSKTTGKNTVYTVTRLKDGTYVRLALSTELTHEFLLWLFAPIAFLSLCLAVMMFTFAKNRQVEKMRQVFVANVSHELKTPLTSIKGFAELTAAGLVTSLEKVKDYQQKIVSQSDRLLTMIDDILHLSKLENTNPKNLVPVNTRAIANQVKEALKHVADEKNIIIQISGDGRILAEVEPVYHLIYNLTDNGIKYGKKGGFVKIILNDKKITVADNGIGIPPEDAERVFERFYRVDKSRSKESGCTGLGIAIVKHSVQQYDGTVAIKTGDGTQIIAEFKK
jgi:two-component system phosphate regulon sensor histidine kinase PhoR